MNTDASSSKHRDLHSEANRRICNSAGTKSVVCDVMVVEVGSHSTTIPVEAQTFSQPKVLKNYDSIEINPKTLALATTV